MVMRLACLVAPALVLAWAGPVWAQPKDDPRALEARKACAAGDVDRGIKLLADYLATTEDVTAVYNMGRCYQQNGLSPKAALQFREYLRKARDLSPADRREIEGQIKELEAEPADKTPAATVATPAPAPPSNDAGASLRTAGLAVAAVGLASTGAGFFFMARTRSLEDKVTQASTFNQADNSAGLTARNLQYVTFGVGAAAIITGATLYYLGAAGRSERVAVLPVLAPRAAGAVVRIRL
jgi:hypothetical protein